MRTITETLSAGPGTVCNINNKFCKCLCSFTERFIAFPNSEENVTMAINNFRDIDDCQISMVVGAVDGTHILILSPEVNKVDYFNRKQRFSFNTQAIVGGNLLFYSVTTGFPGSIHDSRAFQNTHVYNEIENLNLIDGPVYHPLC